MLDVVVGDGPQSADPRAGESAGASAAATVRLAATAVTGTGHGLSWRAPSHCGRPVAHWAGLLQPHQLACRINVLVMTRVTFFQPFFIGYMVSGAHLTRHRELLTVWICILENFENFR